MTYSLHWYGMSPAVWDTSSLRKHWHSWVLFWLYVNVTAESWPFSFNTLIHRSQRKAWMISELKTKENTNAFLRIMLPTVCNSRRIQQYEVTFFTPLTPKGHLLLLNAWFTHSKASHHLFLWKPLLGCINQTKVVVRMLNDYLVTPRKAWQSITAVTVCSY